VVKIFGFTIIRTKLLIDKKNKLIDQANEARNENFKMKEKLFNLKIKDSGLEIKEKIKQINLLKEFEPRELYLLIQDIFMAKSTPLGYSVEKILQSGHIINQVEIMNDWKFFDHNKNRYYFPKLNEKKNLQTT